MTPKRIALLGAAVFASGCSTTAAISFERPQIEVSTAAQLETLDELGYDPILVPELGSAIYVDRGPAESTAPVGLSIAALDVSSAPVDPVGVRADGEMEIPEPVRVGWYSFGPSPGEPGSAVLAAHIASGGVDGVFGDLHRLVTGDEIRISYDDGSVSTYRVELLVKYGKTELPFKELFARSGEPRLVLITCGGDFNTSIGGYSDNIVVYAAEI